MKRSLALASLLLLSSCMKPDLEKNSSARVEPLPQASAAAKAPSPVPAQATATATATAQPDPGPPTTLPEGIEVITAAQLKDRIRSSKAKATIVNAWASWCGPCRREFPLLVKLRDEWRSRGVEVLFISVDEAESTPAALTFAEEHGVKPPVLVASRPLGPFKQELHAGWPGMLPASFLFDEEAKLRYFWGGEVFEKELRPIVEGLLEGKDIDGEARFGLIPGKDYR